MGEKKTTKNWVVMSYGCKSEADFNMKPVIMSYTGVHQRELSQTSVNNLMTLYLT